jgi:hypothetical protein
VPPPLVVMIDRLIEVSLRNRFLVVAFFLLIGGCGYWALLTTPIDAIPDLSDNQVIVFTDWRGRSPQEVEDQVTYPLTVSLQGLPGVPRTVPAACASDRRPPAGSYLATHRADVARHLRALHDAQAHSV